MSVSAEAGIFGFGGDSWKEEALLHDGSKIIVTRTQSHGGRGEIGQSPIKEQSISFTIPGANKPIVWNDDYSEDVGHSNFDLLALHIMNGTAYITNSADGCLSYGKWGRPNPPYILFKYDKGAWKRISLSEFPLEFQKINLVINTSAHEKKLVAENIKLGFVSAGSINRLNSSLSQPEYKTILREPLDARDLCPQHSPGPKAPIPITPTK